MDVKLYANQGLLDMIGKKNTKNKTKELETDDDKKKFVEDLVKFSKEAKESRKEQLLSGVFQSSNEQTQTDSLSKYINKLKKQHNSLKSQMSNLNLQDRKSIQGQISFVESQLQTLELKRIEILRAEAGL